MSDRRQSTTGEFKLWHQLLAGAGAGATGDLVSHPIDTVRARVQVAKQARGVSFLSVLRETLRAEGARGLYRGFEATLCGTIPAHALYFSGYSLTKRLLASVSADPEAAANSIATHAVAGLAAELGGACIWVPTDVVKQNTQVHRRFSNVRSALAEILRESGVRGLFRGYTLSVATYAPFVSVYFVAYEQMKALFQRRSNVPVSVPHFMTSGFAAGAIAAALTSPLDMVKTRLQTQTAEMPQLSSFQIARDIVRTSGWAGFFRGITSRVLWIAPNTAITIAVFETIAAALQSRSSS